MLGHFQNTVDLVDRRLLIAEHSSQARSVPVSEGGSLAKKAAEDLAAVDRFMASVTDKTLIEKDGDMGTTRNSRCATLEPGSSCKPEHQARQHETGQEHDRRKSFSWSFGEKHGSVSRMMTSKAEI